MNMPAHRGFTIIEVMLFLAISGLLIAMLLGGWNLLINTQRYKDSVDTVYGYFQDQYNLVYNVENERGTSLTCTADGRIVENGGASVDSRGQSDCVLMGRFIKLTEGTKLQSYAVVGRKPVSPVSGGDTEQIKDYNPTVVGQEIGLTEAEQMVPWGAALNRPHSTNPLSATILLLRSPASGVVHRYVVDGAREGTVIKDSDIATENESQDSEFCFDAGAIVQGGKQAVVIRKYASSRNSVETLGGSDNGC